MLNGMAKVGDIVYRVGHHTEYFLNTLEVIEISKGKNTVYDMLTCRRKEDGREERRECIYYYLSAKTAWQNTFDIESKAMIYMSNQVRLKTIALEFMQKEIDKL